MRILVDTNIFLDIILNREELMNESLVVLDTIKARNDEMYINASSMKDIYYFAKKKYHDAKTANMFINEIYSKVTKIISFTSDDAIEALYQDGDFEDRCLIESAKRNMCDAIITRNVKDFAESKIPVFSPKTFLKNR